ncbi:PREDICTED: NADH kinase isoform X2 [Nicotiana attenuata]|uniref:NADH kinase n=1 Tax=Nicotiana attenuata TaxID=49451 RepID=A0A1J6JWY1_NICAT|nr:PREDICTED: NADH kinase isoform X2 [Nicotiana attenuata]OIT22266.1 nadh kinase [Nicotiana attenuata]
MARRRLLLLLKPFDVLPTNQSDNIFHFRNPKVLKYLDNRRLVHKEAINFCQNILRKKLVDWEAVYRFNLSRPIRDVDLVVTIGGDGTLLQASHFVDNSIPVLGVNSDPTQAKEVEQYSEEFDASRSTGFLCAATVKNFEQIIDDILENHATPSEVSRMSVTLNSKQLSPYALNDVLIAHPCPATVSRFSFRTKKEEQSCSSLVHCRSSGLRVSTAAGSTAAMLSAGGFAMPILSKDLQYIVREPIAPGAYNSLMHGIVKPEELMEIAWYCKEGLIYIDGSHLVHSVQHGDIIELSSNAPTLKVFLPSHLIS